MNQDTSYPPPAQPSMADPAYPPPGEAATYNPPPPAYSTKASEAGMAGGMRPTPAQPQYGVGSAAYNSSATTVVITQPGAYGLVPHNMYPDSTGAIIFSCVVSWCCCCICGIVAFVFASKYLQTGHPHIIFMCSNKQFSVNWNI